MTIYPGYGELCSNAATAKLAACMTDAEIIQAVNDVFVDSFEIPPEDIKPEAQIFIDLGLDSLDVVDLVAAIQKRFGVQVRDDERVRAIRSMQDLYNYLILIRGEQNKA
jgi:acyl carrier protein